MSCASSLCVTGGSQLSGPALELLSRFCWTDPVQWHSVKGGQSVTESFSLQAARYRTPSEGINILINHQLQLVAGQGRLRMKIKSEFASVFTTCIVHPRGTCFYGYSFPILIVAAADYQTLREQSNSPRAFVASIRWVILQYRAHSCLSVKKDRALLNPVCVDASTDVRQDTSETSQPTSR